MNEQDLLRSAVVFLHATLEDLLRSIAEWRLIEQPPADFLKNLPLPDGPGRQTKFDLGQLSRFRGESVEAVIAKAITGFLSKSNYNNVGDVKKVLEQSRVDTADVDDPLAARIMALMKRRHLIVHRADADMRQGSGIHRARSLSRGTVDSWLKSVRDLGESILDQLANEGVHVGGEHGCQ